MLSPTTKKETQQQLINNNQLRIETMHARDWPQCCYNNGDESFIDSPDLAKRSDPTR
jgi:hypothetical protein